MRGSSSTISSYNNIRAPLEVPELAWIRLNSPQYIYHIIPVNAKLGSHMHLTRQVLQLAPQKHTGDHLVRFCTSNAA